MEMFNSKTIFARTVLVSRTRFRPIFGKFLYWPYEILFEGLQEKSNIRFLEDILKFAYFQFSFHINGGNLALRIIIPQFYLLY